MFTYYLRQKKQNTENSLNIKKDSREKLVFVFSKDFCNSNNNIKKIQFIIVYFKTQFIDNKRNCEGKTSGSQSFQRKSFFLLDTIPFSGSFFIQLKLLFLMEAILFIGKYFFQWKPLLSREAVALSGSRSFQGKLFFSGSHHFYQKLFLLVEAILFNGPHWFQQKAFV